MKKFLPELGLAEKSRFLNSFDFVLTDCDGVVWSLIDPIKGCDKALSALKDCGKRVIYVSNNSVRLPEDYLKRISVLGQKPDLEDIVHPAASIVEFLKEANFNGLIYAIGSSSFVNILKEAGFNVIEGPDTPQSESIKHISPLIYDQKPVKAVVIDTDINVNHLKLLKAEQYLKADPECKFIAGAIDATVALSDSYHVIGPGVYVDILEKSTGRKPVVLGKPGHDLGELLKKKYGISNSKRALFVGDMLAQDIAMGKMAGFQTLLVLTGGAKQKDVEAVDNELFTPDYYTNSFADLSEVIREVLIHDNKANL